MALETDASGVVRLGEGECWELSPGTSSESNPRCVIGRRIAMHQGDDGLTTDGG
jgi:hypothetical protein